MKKAVFLDRDGVINCETAYYVFEKEKLKFTPDLFDFLKKIQDQYILVIISNQGGIAKELYTKKQANNFNHHLIAELEKEGIQISEIYYCPHHNEIEPCLCRKPDSLLLEKAIARFNIDIKSSYFIGDSTRDMEAGNKIGLNTIKVDKDSSLMKIINQIDLS
jgi:D-glycero-D-manno-heptose 1,7-bisphosphate phosphatase